MEVALLLVAEADAVLARLFLLLLRALRDHIDLLINLILLLEDILLRRVESWLKSLQYLDHKLRVLGVVPVVDIGVKVWSLNPLHVFLLHPEMYLE